MTAIYRDNHVTKRLAYADPPYIGQAKKHYRCEEIDHKELLERLQTYDGCSIRRLTPLECERLQAFPDNWTQYGLTPDGNVTEISDTQRYKTMGNAVTTSVITAIGNKLSKSLQAIGV